MDCREAERQMSRFIQRELTEEETADFLEHIRCCSVCRRELETNFFLLEGLRVLDTDSDDFDGTRAMNRELRYEFLRLRRARLRKILRYVMDALTSAGVTVAGLLLLRILYWHAGGKRRKRIGSTKESCID